LATIKTYNLTQRDMEDFMDTAKAAVIKAMVKEGVLDGEEAEDWGMTHTIILRKKNIFRAISNIWDEAKEVDGDYVLVVTLPEDSYSDDDGDGAREDLPEEPDDDGEVEEESELKGGPAKVIELKRRA